MMMIDDDDDDDDDRDNAYTMMSGGSMNRMSFVRIGRLLLKCDRNRRLMRAILRFEMVKRAPSRPPIRPRLAAGRNIITFTGIV